MDREVKAKWTEALRSGKYQQSKGRLHIKPAGDIAEGYCCLGVLTDVYCKEAGKAWEDVLVGCTTANAAYLPHEVADWAGFTMGERELQGRDGVDIIICPDADESLTSEFEYHRASAINDNFVNCRTKKGSFNDIADAIEENL